MKPPLIFVDPPTLASMLEKGQGRPNQWMACCPLHGDVTPSLSIRWGRNGGTVVKCHARCTQKELLAHFRSLGLTLKPLPPPMPEKRKRPVTRAESVALIACTLSERRMLSLILADGSPTYDDFEAAGARHAAISPGLRALEAVGLIDAKRKPRKKGTLRYERNRYEASDQWRRWEPPSSSKAAKKEALARVRAVAAAAREANPKGPFRPLSEGPPIGSVSAPLIGSVSKGPAIGSDSYPDSYEKEESLALKVANASRMELYEVLQGKTCARGDDDELEGSARAVLEPPLRCDGDPGPTSADGYGFAPHLEVAREPEPAPVAGLCRYACARAGECVEPGGVCVKRRVAAFLPPASVERRRSVSARGRTSEWR